MRDTGYEISPPWIDILEGVFIYRGVFSIDPMRGKSNSEVGEPAYMLLSPTDNPPLKALTRNIFSAKRHP
jgi:hypothetical protein